MTSKTLPLALAVIVSAASAPAGESHLGLPIRVTAADFVGVVEIRAVWASPAAKLSEQEREGAYLQRADAYVVETLKGEDMSGRITINFDTGYGCPNFIFKERTRYVVFLVGQPDGTFSPFTQNGLEVVDGVVRSWEGQEYVPLDRVRREVTSAIVQAALEWDVRNSPR